ncbi:hypothetical protein KJ611_02030 [Patescibacteria group bacterium]|nr:hypothetical protein [Patescibacteria group bacterium]MBU1705460.1 hypothetical protein [Patescibacteria group bacterium]
MTDKELVKLLKKYKDTPELGGGASDFNWENSWSKVCTELGWDAQHVSQRHFSLFDYAQFAGHELSRTILQPAAVTFVALVLLMGGWTATVNASFSVPGDMLYPVKLATERVRLTMASTAQARAELHVEFAGRRLKEISEIKGSDATLVNMAVSNFNNQMNLVNKELSDVKNENPDAALALAVMVGQKANEYEATLGQNQEGNQEVASALESVVAADTNALDTIVTSHENTGASESGEMLQQNFQNKYRLLRGRIALSLGRLQVVEGVLEDDGQLNVYLAQIRSAREQILDVDQALRLAMDTLADGGYRSAFDILKRIDLDLRLSENQITELEITITAPVPVEPTEPANPVNNSFEEVVVPESF